MQNLNDPSLHVHVQYRHEALLAEAAHHHLIRQAKASRHQRSKARHAVRRPAFSGLNPGRIWQSLSK